MKKLIVLVLVLGLAGSAHAVIEGFAYPDQVLDANGIGNLVNFRDTGADPLPEDPRDPWEADIVSNQLQWYGYSAGNAEADWMEAIDIVAAPIQVLSVDFRFDENAVGGRSRFAVCSGSGYDVRSGFEVDTYPQVELGGSGTRQYIDLAPQLDTWYTMEYEMNWTAGSFRGRLYETGTTVPDWTLPVLMKSAAQYDRFWLYNNGLVTIDNMSLTPEPATIALLGMGALALIRKRR